MYYILYNINCTCRCKHKKIIFVMCGIALSEFVTLVFTVSNLAGDPAFKPVIRIPVPQEVSVKRSAKECASKASFKQRLRVAFDFCYQLFISYYLRRSHAGQWPMIVLLLATKSFFDY